MRSLWNSLRGMVSGVTAMGGAGAHALRSLKEGVAGWDNRVTAGKVE